MNEICRKKNVWIQPFKIALFRCENENELHEMKVNRGIFTKVTIVLDPQLR